MNCVACFRGFLSFIIILNMILGLAIVGSLLWLYLDGAELWIILYGFNIGPVISEIECFHYVLYSLLILGAIKVFMSFIGCCSVSKKFFVPVFLLFGVQIACGVCVWYFKDQFTGQSKQALTRFVWEGYESMNTTTDLAFDRLQSQSKCCGSEGPSDWSMAVYNEDDSREVYMVPASCCIAADSLTCNQSRIVNNDILDDAIFKEGCLMKILDPVYKYIYRYEALGILGGYILIEFIVMTLKVLACRERYTDYEDSHMMELKPYR